MVSRYVKTVLFFFSVYIGNKHRKVNIWPTYMCVRDKRIKRPMKKNTQNHSHVQRYNGLPLSCKWVVFFVFVFLQAERLHHLYFFFVSSSMEERFIQLEQLRDTSTLSCVYFTSIGPLSKRFVICFFFQWSKKCTVDFKS